MNSSGFLIRCRCAPLVQCPNAMPSCTSTTGCYQSVVLHPTYGYVQREIFGCFSNNTNQVELHCRQSPFTNRLVYCCTPSDGDFCNNNLASSFPRNPFSAFFGFRNYSAVGLVIVLPLLTLLCGLLAICLFWRCVLRARLKRYKIPIESHLMLQQRPHRPILCGFLRNPLCLLANRRHADSSNRFIPEENVALNRTEKALQELVNYTSGSGSGLPFLVQRTIARHIQLQSCIGTGRFGEVWRATYQEETVAVKIFSSRDEASWARETEVYSTGLVHHPNLLAYYASDMISRGGCTQLWLITAYHANGSLFDYLNQTMLSISECFRLARSISAGLAFLHTDIRGLQSKPSIAHRDIKSKNILVRDDKEACIADFGLALVLARSTNEGSGQYSSVHCSTDWSMTNSDGPTAGTSGPSSLGPPQPPCPRVGTKRYMAPELLLAVDSRRPSNSFYPDNSCNLSEEDLFGHPSTLPFLPFEVYQAADVYAMSLVLWEIMRCTGGSLRETSSVEGYEIPFHNMVPPDPTFTQMRSVVCANLPTSDATSSCCSRKVDDNLLSYAYTECRPPISPRWLIDPHLSRLTHVMQECWHWNWASRLPVLRVRKKLEILESSLSV